MRTFARYGYTVELDETAVRDWYAQAGEWGCTCGHCRNFLALARRRQLPEELLDLLDSLSLPPEKATYVCELYHADDWREKGLLYQLSWRLAGKIVDRPAGPDNGVGWGPLVSRPWGGLMLGHETCPVEPEFPAPHFDVSCTLYLPWMLDEPIEGPNEEN